MALIDHVRQMFAMLQALWHYLLLAYYEAALENVGHMHRDSPKLTRKIMRSRIIVNDFWTSVKDGR